MRMLAEINADNHQPKGTRFVRNAVRAIIVRAGQVLLVRSEKFGEYKFPGGGMEKGESQIDTLIREVKEETGYDIVAGSVREYGKTIERRPDSFSEADTFEQHSHYYTCDISGEASALKLDPYEAEYGYKAHFADLQKAMAENEKRQQNTTDIPWTKRDLIVMRLVQEELL